MNRLKKPITANVFMIMLFMNRLAQGNTGPISRPSFHPAMNFQAGLMPGQCTLTELQHNQGQL